MSSPLSALTRAISGGGKGLLNIRVPSFGNNFSLGTSNVASIGELATSITNSASNLIKAANMVYCAGQMITNPGMLLNVLDMVGNNLLAAATDMASRLFAICKGQITQALSQITGSIQGLVNNALGFLGSILDLCEAIGDLIESLKNIGVNDYDIFMSKEDCEYMFASLAACMLNKMLGSKLQKLEQKIAGKITEVGQDLNSAIASELADVNTMSSYLERERFMMEKATKQIKGVDSLLN